MVRQEKSSSIKVGEENLWVCQLEVSRSVGEKILIRQTIEICGGGLLESVKVFSEPINKEF